MDFAGIKALLQGPRLGRESTTKLSVLIENTSNLARCLEITTRAEIDLYNQLDRTSKELRLGGGCKHGADQGKRCKLCNGVLVGPYALLPDGLEVAEHATKLLSEKSVEKLNADISRINSALTEVDSKLKLIKKKIDEFEKRQCKRNKSTVAVAAAQSILEIKKKSGVVFNSAGAQLKHTIHVCGKLGGKTIPVEVNLEEDGDLLNKLYTAIEIKQLECFGRRVSIKALTSPRDTKLVDLVEFFEDYEHQEGDVFRFEANTIEHESLPICYSRACKTIGVEVNPLLLGAFFTQQASTSIILARKSYALEFSVFETLRFNSTLTQLNLCGTLFDLKEHCNAIGTLVNLQGLNIAASRSSKTCELKALCVALDLWKNYLPELQQLDISNWRMIESNSLSDFAAVFLRFVKKHVGLKELKMNRCFYVTLHSFLSDDDVENAKAFYVEALVPALRECALHLFEFESNVFFETDCDDLLQTMLSQHGATTLSLACCRTWLENEIDDRMVVDSFLWPKHMTCSLISLNLSQCNLGDTGLMSFLGGEEAFANLQSLNVSSVGAGTLGLTTLCQRIAQDKFPSLTVLVISGNYKNAFAGPNASTLVGLGNVTGEIHMQGFEGLCTEDFAPLVRLTKLTITRFADSVLDCCQLFDHVLPALQKLTVFSNIPWTINHSAVKQKMMGEVVFCRE